MNNLIDLLNTDNIIIRNKLWLLNRLLEWYKFKMNNVDNNNIEFINQFKYLIEDHFNREMINENEMKDEMKEMFRKLNIKLKNIKYNNYIDLYKIKDEKIKDLIINCYVEKNEIEFEKNNNEILKRVKEEELNDIIINLIKIDDVKMIEIALLIMMNNNQKIEKYISRMEIRNILSKLCNEYNENKRNRTIKCLSLFVDNNKAVSTIQNLCGKEIIFRILNEKDYLNPISKELLMRNIEEMNLDENEKEEMRKIIRNEDLLEELRTKEITSFSYPQPEYSFGLNEEISIIPSFDGEECEFSISPSLPDGLVIDEENGIIDGKASKEMTKKEYEITCKNIRNEKKFKISLEFVDIKFTELNKSKGISISKKGKLIANIKKHYHHCYLDLKMESGVYHIKYQVNQNESENYEFFLGLSTNNTFSGNDISVQSTTCNYYECDFESQDITDWCDIGTVVTSNPSFDNYGDNSIYEIIVDMNKREFWLSHNYSSPVLLVKDLPSPLYPYAELLWKYMSLEVLSYSHQY